MSSILRYVQDIFHGVEIDWNPLVDDTYFFSREKCRKVHKQVPVQIKGKIAARVCPGKSEYEYTPSEIREMDFTGY